MNSVKFKNSLALHNFIFGLIKRVSLKIKEIENYQGLKMNPELTTYILQCINEEIAQINKTWVSKIDVKTIITEILSSVFDLSDSEISQIESQLTYIVDNGIVKKKGLVSKLKNAVSSVSNLVSSSSDPLASISTPPIITSSTATTNQNTTSTS